MFAKFDEIQSMTLQDIKETKRYGQTHRHTDGQRDNSIPSTKKVCGGIIITQFIIGFYEILSYCVSSPTCVSPNTDVK